VLAQFTNQTEILLKIQVCGIWQSVTSQKTWIFSNTVMRTSSRSYTFQTFLHTTNHAYPPCCKCPVLSCNIKDVKYHHLYHTVFRCNICCPIHVKGKPCKLPKKGMGFNCNRLIQISLHPLACSFHLSWTSRGACFLNAVNDRSWTYICTLPLQPAFILCFHV
jgi:hypothetical protein